MAIEIPIQTRIDVLAAAIDRADQEFICASLRITPDAYRQVLTIYGFPSRARMEQAMNLLEQELEGGASAATLHDLDEVAREFGVDLAEQVPDSDSPSPESEQGTPDDGGAEAPDASPMVELARAAHASAGASVERATSAPSSPTSISVSTSAAGPCEHATLLRRAAASPKVRTQNQGIKIAALIAELTTTLEAERRERAEKAAAARAKEKAREQAKLQAAARRRAERARGDAETAARVLAQLEEQEAEIRRAREAAQAKLDAANAAASEYATTLPAEAAPDEAPAATVREWARETGLACPSTGRLPAAVREAYAAAHPKEAAA